MSGTDKTTTDKDESKLGELDNEVEEETIEQPEVYTCPVPECGKSFDKETSLRMHMLRSHKISPHERKKEKPIRERGKPPAYRPTLEEAGVPDSYTLLKNQLLLYGLNTRDSDAVVDYMSSFNPDDLVVLNRALSNVGMPLNRKRMFLESWINARDLSITRELAKELDLVEPRRRDWRREYGYRSLKDRGYGDEETRGGDILTGMAKVIEALKSSEGARGDPEMMRTLGSLETQVANLMNRPTDTGNSQVVSSLSNQVSELSKKLEEEKEKRLMDRFDGLEKRMEDISRNADKEPLTAAIHELGDMVKVFIKGVTVGYNPEKPKREKVPRVEGEKSVEDYVKEVAPELIE